MTLRPLTVALTIGLACLAGCQPQAPAASDTAATATTDREATVAASVASYAEVPLTADLSHLPEGDRQAVGLLIDAGQIIDALFWKQIWGDKDALLAQAPDAASRRFVEINYGPWNLLDNDEPFIPGIKARPDGAQFYPTDMTRAEFDAAQLPGKDSLYTLIQRDSAGKLLAVPYSQAYKAELEQVAALLRRASEVASDKAFAHYLTLRADALLSNEYQASDMAWMDSKTSPIDVVIGPIESYQDRLYGTKASFEAFVLVKDIAWSQKLARFAAHLPALQRGLPVDAKYKAEMPGTDADLNAYFAVFYGGDANAGAKTIAINLPNDEQVQLAKGSRRLQLENTMRAKFDTIMAPIAAELIAPAQLPHVTFDAFFENVMFHEVAHGLGIKNTLDGRGTVRQALSELASSYEEGKADILGLYMIAALGQMGELDQARLMDNYVTFLAGIFRSVRFGASSAHGQANMVAFNYLAQAGAFSRDAQGHYTVDLEKMQQAVNSLSARILTLQGNGDRAGAQALLDSHGHIGNDLAQDLQRLQARAIPVDIVLRQGRSELGL